VTEADQASDRGTVTEINDRLAEVALAPQGGRVAAFFDFDGTLIDGDSALAWTQHLARTRELSPIDLAGPILVGLEAAIGRADVERLMRVGARALRGRNVTDMAELGERLLRSALGGVSDARRLLTAHRERGHRVVIASSALPFQVQPLAGELMVDDVLCTELEEKGGVLTGEVAGPVLWGASKAAAVQRFAARNKIDVAESFGYGNRAEEAEFLSLVGRPRPVNPTPELARLAEQRGWPATRFEGPARPGLLEVARTVGAFGGLAAAFGTGVAVGLLNGSRRDAANITMSAGSDLALWLAGVRVNVTGEEHLWSHRPAVFIMNHQSLLDGFVVMKLLREDMTGVAKIEVAKQPVLGQFARMANMAFIDRGDSAQARRALQPVVQRLREGYSIAIAAEGTRSPTARVGRFKKGAFHMAMQGGVPIVPIVIRNTGELLWRGSTFIHPGTIDVVVHPPISLADWQADELDQRIVEVRELFVRTLEAWPTAPPPRVGDGAARAGNPGPPA
jgi:putative phosphoserine phosphatase/1-acylglycerol-3-phosphate O-acyltransferase